MTRCREGANREISSCSALARLLLEQWHLSESGGIWLCLFLPVPPWLLSSPSTKQGQFNGGEFAPLTVDDWMLIRPYLEQNESIFGIALDRLLTDNGSSREPTRVYRKIQPSGYKALMPEEAWVRRKA